MMNGSDDHSDSYLAKLQAEGRELDRREAEDQKAEEALRLRRERTAEDRRIWQGAISHYTGHLRATGQPIPAFVSASLATPAESEDDLIATPRVGEKRRIVLLHLAKATVAGKALTTKEITAQTGLESTLVHNVVWADHKRRFLARAGDRISMTDRGFLLLKQAGIFERSQKD